MTKPTWLARLRTAISRKPQPVAITAHNETRITETAPTVTPGETGKKAGKWTQFAPPSPKGGALLPVGAHPGNTGGQPGRSGPKPATWKTRCAQALENANALGVLEQMIEDKKAKDKDRLGATEFLARYGHGLPVQKVEGEMRHLLVVGSVGAADELLALPPSDGDDA